MIETSIPGFRLKTAERKDVPLILEMIKGLALYEKLLDEVVATEEMLDTYLFGDEKAAEVIIGYEQDTPVGFVLFFKSFSTFLGRPGIYLEDLFVYEQYRGKGYGKLLLIYLSLLTEQRGFGRLEWAVLDWNTPAIEFYNSLGARQMNEWILNRVSGNALIELAAKF